MLIIGLGNPGKAYARTYHNTGYLAVDFLTGGARFAATPLKQFLYFKKGGDVFVKPLTFMNDSGAAAKEALKYFKMKPEECAVVHDDSDIELGAFKIAFARGSAGHKGVESVIAHLGTNGFWRVRIGVRKRRGKAGDLVLKPIAPKDRVALEEVFAQIGEKIKNDASKAKNVSV